MWVDQERIENEEEREDLLYLYATSASNMTKILRHAKEIMLNKLQVESGCRVSIIEKGSNNAGKRSKRINDAN